MKYLQILLLLLVLPLGSGCLYNIPDSAIQGQISVYSDITSKVQIVVKDIPQNDKETLSKMFQGFVRLINSDLAPNSTVDALGQLDKVEKLYKWSPEKYPKLTDCVESILKDKSYCKFDYSVPQRISDCKENLTQIFNSIVAGL